MKLFQKGKRCAGSSRPSTGVDRHLLEAAWRFAEESTSLTRDLGGSGSTKETPVDLDLARVGKHPSWARATD